MAPVLTLWMTGSSIRLPGDPRPAAGSVTVLRPMDWVGKDLPLLDHTRLRGGGDLRRGHWTLVLYDHNCEKCSDFLRRRFPATGRDVPAPRQDAATTVLVNIAGGCDGVRSLDHRAVRCGQLDQGRLWYAPVPSEITLEDGRVTSAVVH
jgi:hypothetical protein